MKRIAAGLVVAVLTGTACLAQTAPSAPPGPAPGPGSGDGRAESQERRGPPEADRERGDRDGGWRPHRFMMGGMKGGHLRFRRGETGIDFRCAADDSTKACVEALMPLLDKLLQGR